ncbi:peroxiredoxin [Neorickettsia sennetsu]|uniref:thioredoxin-dependent peroxiredoxin n=1 Tax=Ehrlichia sennetsu (strain ATCC VR-367 / Miyayama) TaxID=222891 RepID=Q2GD47_EHRS3|nr:peroxiredoxin [Neorickettsia sennetsu]ABD45915.1 bacterioferritin comigratory protein [Neorickettsia sennetsu str. Miyayama]
MSTLEVDDLAPSFYLPSSMGGMISLQDFLGKAGLVIYFYPKDDTPGCTQEAKDFKEHIAEFKELNVVVIGISKDNLRAHKNFSTRYDLPFHLLSDESTETIQKYGAWVEKSMFGKKYYGIERSTFVVDLNGKVRKLWRRVRVSGHVKEVLDFCRSNQFRNAS